VISLHSSTSEHSVPTSQSIFSINRYLPFILVYFFFNNAGLPHGLVYTSVLAPLLYLWLIKNQIKYVFTKFFIVLSPFFIFHLKNGIVLKDYLVSSILIATVYVASCTIYFGLKRVKNLEKRILTIIYLNFALAFVGLILKRTPFASWMWRVKDVISANIDSMMRFKMFVYEPSYYSTLLVPLLLYAYFRCLHSASRKNIVLLFMVMIPLLMSYSFGVISALILSVGLVHLVYFRKILRLNRKYLLFFPFLVMLLLLFVFSGSFSQRIANVVSGEDTSGQARTILAYTFGYEIAKTKSLAWGVGPGQPKLIGKEIIANINPFWAENDPHLPCAIAETLATFGLLGLLLRIVVEIYLFFRARVFENYFRLSLFLFIFIYQFTGSFLTNIAEYAIWILAFSKLLPEFDVVVRKSARRLRRRNPLENQKPLSGATV